MVKSGASPSDCSGPWLTSDQRRLQRRSSSDDCPARATATDRRIDHGNGARARRYPTTAAWHAGSPQQCPHGTRDLGLPAVREGAERKLRPRPSRGKPVLAAGTATRPWLAARKAQRKLNRPSPLKPRGFRTGHALVPAGKSRTHPRAWAERTSNPAPSGIGRLREILAVPAFQCLRRPLRLPMPVPFQ